MTRAMRRGLTVILTCVLLGACSTAASPATGPVSATLKEWQITLSATNLKAGSITFNVKNDGDKEHEFVVRKTDLKPDALPLNADGEVSEDAPELKEVGDPSEVEERKAGETGTLTVDLQPGHYVVFCNLHVEDLLHYQKGMRAEFTVS